MEISNIKRQDEVYHELEKNYNLLLEQVDLQIKKRIRS